MNELKTFKTVLVIIGALFILLASQIISSVIASLLNVIGIPVFIADAAAGILYLILAFLLLKLLSEKLLKCQLKDFLIPKFGLKIKWVIAALLLPVSVTAAYLLMGGELINGGMSTDKILETVCAGVFFTGLGAGFVEEMVFRGFIMNLIMNKWNKPAAVIIPSVLFGFVHIIGMDFNLLSAVQVIAAGTVVGIMFSLIALENNSIWNSAVVHSVWNIIIVGGILSVGEKINEDAVYSYVLNTNNFAVTGGEFGIESSVISIVGYLAVAAIAAAGIKKSSGK